MRKKQLFPSRPLGETRMHQKVSIMAFSKTTPPPDGPPTGQISVSKVDGSSLTHSLHKMLYFELLSAVIPPLTTEVQSPQNMHHITVTTTKTCLYADVYSASGPCHRRLTLFRQFRRWQNTRSIISSRCKRTHRLRGHMAERSTDPTPHRSPQPLCGEVPFHRRPNPLIPHQSLVHIPRH